MFIFAWFLGVLQDLNMQANFSSLQIYCSGSILYTSRGSVQYTSRGSILYASYFLDCALCLAFPMLFRENLIYTFQYFNTVYPSKEEYSHEVICFMMLLKNVN